MGRLASHLLLASLLLLAAEAQAKRFRNAYVSFELPPNWNCKLEGAEWVCQNDFTQKAKEAIIILTAKEVGPTDSLPAYKAYLETPRTLPGKGGAPTKSQVLHVRDRMIQNQMWIDGMHLGSEVGPYFTRYLATIKDKIAILVTFSAHKQHYTKYSGDFRKAIDSMAVVATKDLLADKGSGGIGPNRGNESIGAPIGQNISSFETDNMPMEGSSSKKDLYINLLILAFLLAAVGGYFYFKGGKK